MISANNQLKKKLHRLWNQDLLAFKISHVAIKFVNS